MELTRHLIDTRNVIILVTLLMVLEGFGIASAQIQQNWVRLATVDTCYLPLTGGTQTTAASLSRCLMSGLTNQKKVASFDETSGNCTLHDQTTILSISGDVYVLSPNDCSDVDPTCSSGVHRITTPTGMSFDIFCDMDTDDGPWNVIQNRGSIDVDFYRDWVEYRTGFGQLSGNFWLGNEKIYSMVTFTPYKLRIKLEAWDGTIGIAEYSLFRISNEADGYKLTLDGFSGNISNGMNNVSGEMFTTRDRDHDGVLTRNCAETRHGAWWYRACSHANLNGRYTTDTGNSKSSMYWKHFFDGRLYVPMRKTRMMINR